MVSRFWLRESARTRVALALWLRLSLGSGSVRASSREVTICQERAWVMSAESGSTPIRRPWSRTKEPAKEL